MQSTHQLRSVVPIRYILHAWILIAPLRTLVDCGGTVNVACWPLTRLVNHAGRQVEGPCVVSEIMIRSAVPAAFASRRASCAVVVAAGGRPRRLSAYYARLITGYGKALCPGPLACRAKANPSRSSSTSPETSGPWYRDNSQRAVLLRPLWGTELQSYNSEWSGCVPML